MDTSDVYLISVDGWVDSEHRLHIVIDGNSPDLRGVVQELDQETMEVLSEHELSPDLFTYDMDLYVTLGPGLHFIEFYPRQRFNPPRSELGQRSSGTGIQH